MGTGRMTKMVNKTLRADQLPIPMRHPFIQTGYRLMNQSWYYYVISFFKWHNETVNVWTHFVATFGIVALVMNYGKVHDLIDSSEGNKLFVFTLGCLAVTSQSCIAHWFGSRSIKSHVIFFLIDYAGISIYAYTISVGSLYICSEPETFKRLRPFYLPLSVIVGASSFAVNCVAKTWIVEKNYSAKRKFFMVAPNIVFGAYISFPVLPRYWKCFHDNSCDMTSLNPVTLCYALFVLEAAVYAMHIPERFLPKRCDNFGQSHQIFHVCVFVTIVTQLYAIDCDIKTGHSRQFEFDFKKSLVGFVSLCVSLGVIIVLFLPAINKLSQDFKLPPKSTSKKRK